LAIKRIVNYPAEILEKPCRAVVKFDRKLGKLLDDMYETMIEHDGVGLAAPQIGMDERIAIVDIDDESGTIEMINPRILKASGEQIGPEGCLSFPDLYGEVMRANYVMIEALDRKGRKYTLEAEGFLARALQHEIDHLDGILFTSKVIRYLDQEELKGGEAKMMKIVFMGTPDFSVPVLRQIIDDGYDVIGVVTQPDRPVGRKRVLTPPPVKVEALKHGIPVFQPEKIRQREELDQILSLQPDLIVTAAFGQILPKELLEAPQHGCINVHASLLPELRGGAPIHYAIIQGKKKTGITIMYMVEKLDAGDILSSVEVPITDEDNVGTMHEKLSQAGAELLSKTLPLLLVGSLTPIPQNNAKATFAANIKHEQEKIDWTKSGEEIYDHIRGLNPWPGAFTSMDGHVWKIWSSEKIFGTSKEMPGTILKVEQDGITVSTGNETAIKIKEIQPSGKTKMTSEVFLRGAGSKISKGTKLGD
jgi:methionyl-tRNA formyltransferase